MKCSEFGIRLPLLDDGVLGLDERAATEKHLAECPPCRYRKAEYAEIRADLSKAFYRGMPPQVMTSVRSSVAAELAGGRSGARSFIPSDILLWAQMRLMPVGVGVATSLVVGISLMWAMFSGQLAPLDKAASVDSARPADRAYILGNTEMVPYPGDLSISSPAFASTRSAVAEESPSVNPNGALIALTKSLVRGHMEDDEVVVVADVFGNGLARIAEVVEPSEDRQAVRELERALESDPAFAPFVPASVDRRSETVRVILKIQHVDVETGLSRADRRML